MKILFKYPCRGRERLFFESLDSIQNNIRDTDNYHISLTLDTDDEILNRPEVIERIGKYPNTSIEWGLSSSKIEAINRSMPDYDFDILICWSNDMIATFYGFDDVIRQHILEHLPDLDGLVHFPEPDTKDILNTLYIVTKKYYSRFNYIYHPSYFSLWADNESYDVAKILKRYHFFNFTGLFVHKNPAYSHSLQNRDALFEKQQAYWEQDEKNYYERKGRNFDL